MTYRDILARSERLRPDGTPVWPLGFRDRPRAIETRRAETLCGSVADESAARQGAAPLYSKDHPHA